MTIFLTAAISVLVTVAVVVSWNLFVGRKHRGAHGRHDLNYTSTALIADTSRAVEPYREFKARRMLQQRRRNEPHFAGRHAAPEPETSPSGPSGRATLA